MASEKRRVLEGQDTSRERPQRANKVRQSLGTRWQRLYKQVENRGRGVFSTEPEIAERKVAGSTEHATPQNKTRRRRPGEMVTFNKTNFMRFQKRINKFPCEARLKGGGREAQEGWQFLQETH